MVRIGRGGRDLPRYDQALSSRRARAAFVGMAAVDDDGGLVETGLEEALVGSIADGIRHYAVGVGDHAVGGNDDVALDAAQGDGTASRIPRGISTAR